MSDQFSEIPTSEIIQDIAATEREIETMKREITGLRMMSDRMSSFRADAREGGIRERQQFIEKLQVILKARGHQ